MPDDHPGKDHAELVAQWLERATSGLDPVRLPELLDAALATLWKRTQLTLGDVTISAIVDRVLHIAAERFPILSPLAVELTGVQFQGLSARAASVPTEEMVAALRLVLTELLTIIANLTADVLTPALHAELAKVALDPAAREDKPS